MEKQWIVLAGEEASPKSNKLGGIWEVIDAEAATLASLISKGEINDNAKVIVTGPYYRCDGCDWNTEQNRITKLDGLKKLSPDKDLKKAINTIRDKSKYRMMSQEAFNLARDMSWVDPVKKYYAVLSIR